SFARPRHASGTLGWCSPGPTATDSARTRLPIDSGLAGVAAQMRTGLQTAEGREPLLRFPVTPFVLTLAAQPPYQCSNSWPSPGIGLVTRWAFAADVRRRT